jgi:hypothetical protein
VLPGLLGGEDTLGDIPKDGGVYKKQGKTFTCFASSGKSQSYHSSLPSTCHSAHDIPVRKCFIPNFPKSFMASFTSWYCPGLNHSTIPTIGVFI